MNRILTAFPQDITFASAYSSPTGEYVLDLYKDESIPFQFKVDDFTNVAEKSSSNSKSFEIPGTKNNNIFFNHIYEITSDSEFNPHKKTKVNYKENGIDIFTGYLQLNDIVIKNDNVSYEITLYSETTNLKESIENKTFRDLDLTELEHNYTSTNIKNTFTGSITYNNSSTSGFRDGDSVKYPFVMWNELVTFSWLNTSNSLIEGFGMRDFFRPWVNCRYLLRNILADAGYTYTSDFLDDTYFSKLYVDFNRGDYYFYIEDSIIADGASTSTYTANTTTKLDFTTLQNGANITASDYYDLSTDTITALADNTKINATIRIHVDNIGGGSGVGHSVYVTAYKNGSFAWGNTTSVQDGSDVYINATGAGGIILDTGDTLDFRIEPSGDLELHSDSRATINILNNTINLNDTLDGKRGEINQWEYLKNFIDRFNLLVMASDDNPNNLIIEPYNDWVDTGNLLDWTNKVDDREIKYTPIDGLDRITDFKLEEDSGDKITKEFNKPNDWKFNYKFDSDIEITDNYKKDFLVKGFASTDVRICLGGEMVCPKIIKEEYSYSDYGFENKPRILYNNGVQTLPTHKLYFEGFYNDTEYLLFSPVDSFPVSSTDKSLDFGVVKYGMNSPNPAVLNGLFNEYWSKYIDELYHKDTRIAKVKAYITAKDLNEFSFNDIILIKNRKYRVKMIDYKQDSLSILELITIKEL